MQYGVIPENLLERFALAAGKIPVPLIDALYGIVKSRAIMAGVSLGIFEALGRGPETAAELAVRLRLDPRFLELLLRTLVFCGYLSQKKDRYRLSRISERTMVPGGAMELYGYLRWNYAQWEMVAGLEEAVRSGRGCDFHSTLKDAEAWGHYQRGMLEIARLEADLVAGKLHAPRGARTLLDVGGSHGLFGAAICRRNPPLRATVLDLPEAVGQARELAIDEGISDVVEHRAGHLMEDDWGAGYDMVLLANVLHHFSAEQNRCILKRAAAALCPAGTVVIWEMERPATGSKAGPGDGAALYFALTSGGGAYHGSEYAQWMTEAGLSAVRIARPRTTPGKVLVTACAPDVAF